MSHNCLALIDRAKVLDMVMVFAFKRVILSCEQLVITASQRRALDPLII